MSATQVFGHVEVRACERSREPAFGGRHTGLSSFVCAAERRWHGPFNTDRWRFTSWPPPLSSLPAATSASGGYLVGAAGRFFVLPAPIIRLPPIIGAELGEEVFSNAEVPPGLSKDV